MFIKKYEDEVEINVVVTHDEKYIHASFGVEGTGHMIMVQLDRLEILVNPESGDKLQAVLDRVTDLLEITMEEIIEDIGQEERK